MSQNTSAEHVLKYLIYPLGLSARLRVESRTEGEFGSESFLKLLPESGGELRAAVGHNLFGDSMETHHSMNVQTGQLAAVISGVNGMKWATLVK